MKIVLLENVKKLGKKDEIIEVSDGYARNVLIPKKLGLPATAENLNNVRLKNKNEQKKEENLRGIAEKNKVTLEKEKFVVTIKAGANGKTFGSITTKEIADVIKSTVNIEVDRKDILLDESIKNVGNYDIDVKLHKDIHAIIKVEVKES